METACVDSSLQEFDGLRGREEIEGSWPGVGSRWGGCRESLKWTLGMCVHAVHPRAVLIGKNAFSSQGGARGLCIDVVPMGPQLLSEGDFAGRNCDSSWGWGARRRRKSCCEERKVFQKAVSGDTMRLYGAGTQE